MIVEVKTWGFVGGKREARRQGLSYAPTIDRVIGKMVMDMREETNFKCDSFIITIVPENGDKGGDK